MPINLSSTKGMGTMTRNLWEDAQWIFAEDSEDILNSYFEYLTSFTAYTNEETLLYISAYSQYAVYMNGQFVDCGQYDDYEDLKFYDMISLSKFLISGENQLLIRQYVCGADFFTRRKQVPGIIFKIMVKDTTIYASSPDCLSRTDLRYDRTPERLTPQLGFNFSYDANIPLPEYTPSIPVVKQKDIKIRPVKKAVITPAIPGILTAQGIFLEWNPNAPKALRCQHAYFSAMRKKELMPVKNPEDNSAGKWKIPDGLKADGIYLIFDLGTEKAGFLDFSFTLPEKCEILLSIGEHLNDLRVRSAVGEETSVSDHLAPGRRNFTFRYLAHKGENIFFHPFQRFGLRYLQLMVFCSEIQIGHVGMREALYPLTYCQIPTSDKLHQLIWEAGRRTLRLCMHEHYEDCPWREQALYTMDSRVQMLCGYYAFGEYQFPRANLELIAHSLGKDHLLTLCAPGNAAVNIPSFSAVFVRQVLEYIQYSGDREFAREMLPVLTDIVDGFKERISENGLIPQLPDQWNFYEWQEGLDGLDTLPPPAYDSLLNAFVSDAFACYAEIAEIACQKTSSEKYRNLHAQMNQNIHAMFFRESCGGYATLLTDEMPKHNLTQAVLLYINAVPKTVQTEIAAILKSGKLIPCSLSMTIYEYDALMAACADNRPYIIEKVEAIWGKMLQSGTGTFWETALGADDFDYAGSLCHDWSAVPIYFFGKYGTACGKKGKTYDPKK